VWDAQNITLNCEGKQENETLIPSKIYERLKYVSKMTKSVLNSSLAKNA